MIPPSIYGYLILAALVVSAFVGTYLKGRFDGRRVCNQKIQELMIESTSLSSSGGLHTVWFSFRN